MAAASLCMRVGRHLDAASTTAAACEQRVLIFYADEFGDHSLNLDPDADTPTLKSGTSQLFVLSAVGVRDTSRRPLAEAIFKLKLKHFGAPAAGQVWGETEIKGRYLFRATRSAASGNVLASPSGYQTLDTPEKVSALVKDLGLIFATFRPLIFATVVDKVHMVETGREFHPLGIAYAYMHQRIAMAMEDLYAGDAAIIVADQQTQHEAYFRSGRMNQARSDLDAALPRKPNYDLVLDKPLWVDTDLSSWDREIIQLADIVAYTVAECIKRGQPPVEGNFLWNQIRSGLAVHRRTGGILGGGLSIYPKTATAPKL